MEWFVFFGVVVIYGAARKRYRQQDAIKEANRLASNTLNEAIFKLTTPKGRPPLPGTGEGYIAQSMKVGEHIHINNNPAKGLTEDCETCGASFVVFWIEGPSQVQLQKTHCPFCGTTHRHQS